MKIIDPARICVDPLRGGKKMLGSLAATKLHPLFSWLRDRGIQRAVVCEAAGIPESLVAHPDGMVGLDGVMRLFDAASALAGDELAGLKSGAAVDKGFSHLVGCVMTNTACLQAALDRFVALEKLIDSTAHTGVHIGPDSARISISFRGADPARVSQLAEYRVAGCIAYAGLLAGRRIRPNHVEFAHARRSGIDEYQSALDCEVLFNRGANSIVVGHCILDLPVREPNPDLLRLFESEAALATDVQYGRESLGNELIRRILPTLSGGTPALREVAKGFALGVRTLQERLSREGTSFRQVVEEARKASALKLIRDKSLAIGEIAFLIGFSEASAFHRSFKKWTGMTPREYRDDNGDSGTMAESSPFITRLHGFQTELPIHQSQAT